MLASDVTSRHVNLLSYNPGEDIWNGVQKSTGQEQETFDILSIFFKNLGLDMFGDSYSRHRVPLYLW